MTILEVFLFGGFQAQRNGEPVRGFESRKTRALFAFLLLNQDRGELSRDTLAAMFWPESGEEAARQSLRQALYNIGRTVERGRRTRARGVVEGTSHGVRIAPGGGIWLDVREFERALDAGLDDGRCTNPLAVTTAVNLYGGDLLAGLRVDGCPEFEDWLLLQQERLRDRALAGLRCLVHFHHARGEMATGIQHARRWLEIDPLAEEAHRDLMRLYAHGGWRSRAVAQYEHCTQIMSVELGVPPMEETRLLYESLLAETAEGQEAGPVAEHAGPVIPLVGRRGDYARLRDIWGTVRSGEGRLTILRGAHGTGKTRLARSVLHDITTQGDATVLMSRCPDGPPAGCLQPLGELLESLAGGDQRCQAVLQDEAEEGSWAVLGHFFSQLDPVARDRASASWPEARTVLCGLMRRLAGRSWQDGAGLVLFLDDLQWWDAESLSFLAELVEDLAAVPLWIVGAMRAEEAAAVQEGLLARSGVPSGRLEVIDLAPLDDVAVVQVARSLVNQENAASLAALLRERTGGLPLQVTEWVNLLWDEGVLVHVDERSWALAEGFAAWRAGMPGSLGDLVARRLARLPASTRRLLVLAAVIGPTFEAEVLLASSEEHETVLSVGLEVLLERFLVRHAPRAWFESCRERDVVMWRRGVQSGRFEFSHPAIREHLYGVLDTRRRNVLHGQVAEMLALRPNGGGAAPLERIAAHHLKAGQVGRAATLLWQAARWSEERGLNQGAGMIARRALAARQGVAATGGDEGTPHLWEELEAISTRNGKETR